MKALDNIKASLKNVSLPKLPGMKKIRKSADFLVADLSGETIKLCHAEDEAGLVKIQHIASKKVAEDDEEGISQFLEDNIYQFQVKTKSVQCVIPSKYFISRNIDMPSNDRNEIAKIINLQVGRFTPYSRDEIVVDYICRDMKDQHYTNVLLIIVHRKVVEKYYKYFDRIGFQIEKFCIGSEALSRQYDGWLELGEDHNTVAGLHISESSTDLTVVERGQMVFVRNIPIGWQNIEEEGDGARSEFVQELNKSLTAYQDEGVGQAPQVLALTGIVEEAASLKNMIQNEVSLISEANVDIKIVSYLSQFSLSETCQTMLEMDTEVTYFELLSTLVASRTLKIDLIPNEMKLKRNVREGSREIMTLGILIMTIFLMISFLLSAKLYFKGVQIEELDSAHEETFESARSLERVSTKSRAVRKVLETRGRGLYVFDKVTALIGEDIYLTEFSYDSEGDAITVGGTANSMSRIFAFVTTLEESNYFESVTTKETKSRRQGKVEVADFMIEAVLAEGF